VFQIEGTNKTVGWTGDAEEVGDRLLQHLEACRNTHFQVKVSDRDEAQLCSLYLGERRPGAALLQLLQEALERNGQLVELATGYTYIRVHQGHLFSVQIRGG